MSEKPTDALSAINIGLRIKALRLALGYRKSGEFAETYGGTAQQHSNYERGHNTPNVWPMIHLCERHRGASLEFIFRGIPDSMPYDLAKKTLEILDDLKRGETISIED